MNVFVVHTEMEPEEMIKILCEAEPETLVGSIENGVVLVEPENGKPHIRMVVKKDGDFHLVPMVHNIIEMDNLNYDECPSCRKSVPAQESYECFYCGMCGFSFGPAYMKYEPIAEGYED